MFYKKAYFFVFLLTVFIVPKESVSQDRVPGTLYFEDGTTQSFLDIEELRHCSVECNRNYSRTLAVTYKNSVREIEFGQISEMRIEEYSIEKVTPAPVFWMLENPKVKVKLKNGNQVTSEFTRMRDVTIEVKDELTGEREKLAIDFAADDKLRIRKIVFGSNDE